MSVTTENFNPALTYVVSGTNTSVAQAIDQPTAVGSLGSGNAGGFSEVQFVNPNAYMAFASWSMGTATAGTAGGAPIPASSRVIYDMGGPMKSVAVILGTSSAGNIYVSVGGGS